MLPPACCPAKRCSITPAPGRKRARGSRKRAPSSPSCGGSASCRPKTKPSWRWSTPSRRPTASKSNVFSESFEDLQPKASVSANTGQGPDVVWGLHSLPQLFPDKVLEMNDVADYLGKKYGGWTSAAETTVKRATSGSAFRSPRSAAISTTASLRSRRRASRKFPKDLPGFLELMKALKKNNTPGGFALGHASGDGNAWTHWLLWAHNGVAGRQGRQGHHQLAGNRQGAGIHQAAVGNLHSGLRFVERLVEQQGVPGRRTSLHQ